MVVEQQVRAPFRPACPQHPGSRVRLDGYVHSPWSPAHRRPRYRCVTEPRSRGHVVSLTVPVRQPTEQHPDSGRACPRCEHVYERHEGVRTGRDFVFGHVEIARLFLRLGEGMSLRAASSELRRSIFRTRAGESSREANLAANYLDSFAPAVIEASESLAAYYPWLAQEWHPTKNELRPDQVTRASGRVATWRCAAGHEWQAAVYSRTFSRSGCPTCYAVETSVRIRAGKRRAGRLRDRQANAALDARLRATSSG